MSIIRFEDGHSLISYLRVSDKKQGKSGLGLEAQREIVARFAQAEGQQIAQEFIEVETGKVAMPWNAARNYVQPPQQPKSSSALWWSPN